MRNQLRLNTPEKARLRNIIDMGLNFSAMIRLFQKGSKEKLCEKILGWAEREVFRATSKEEFRKIHSDFCHWGTENIFLAKKLVVQVMVKLQKPSM